MSESLALRVPGGIWHDFRRQELVELPLAGAGGHSAGHAVVEAA